MFNWTGLGHYVSFPRLLQVAALTCLELFLVSGVNRPQKWQRI